MRGRSETAAFHRHYLAACNAHAFDRLPAALLGLAQSAHQQQPVTVETESLTAEAEALVAAHGLRLVCAEDVMRIDLAGDVPGSGCPGPGRGIGAALVVEAPSAPTTPGWTSTSTIRRLGLEPRGQRAARYCPAEA